MEEFLYMGFMISLSVETLEIDWREKLSERSFCAI